MLFKYNKFIIKNDLNYSAAVLADNSADINDWLVRIQLAVMASQGRVSFPDILDFIYGKAPSTAEDSILEDEKEASQTEASSDSNSDTDDELEVNYGPGKIKATPKMWKFLKQMRDSPLITLDEITTSNLYDYTFQSEVEQKLIQFVISKIIRIINLGEPIGA